MTLSGVDSGVILMQSLNYKDFNEKTIFENDILIHPNGYKYIVTYSEINHWWCLCQPMIWIGKSHEPLEKCYTGGIIGQEMQLHLCKILGNKYKNPELIEKAKRKTCQKKKTTTKKSPKKIPVD